MLNYIIKRILLMVPTLFGISVIVFCVVNFAPGQPGASAAVDAAGVGGEQADSVGSPDSYRIFKKTFYLDKPVILNFRPWTVDAADVHEAVDALLAPAWSPDNEEAWQAGELDTEPVPKGDKIDAAIALEDWGHDAVMPLIDIASDQEESLRKRYLALRLLPVSAQARTLIPSAQSRMKRDVPDNPLPADASEEEREAMRAAVDAKTEWWQTWLDEKVTVPSSDLEEGEEPDPDRPTNRERITYTAGEKVWTLFLDTRYAQFMKRLLQLDLGRSNRGAKEPVVDKIVERLPISMTLAICSIIIAYSVSIPLGIFSSVRQDTVLDRVTTVLLFMLYSLPTFFVGTLMMVYLTNDRGIALFPAGQFRSMDTSGMNWWEQIVDVAYHITLPLICLTYMSFAALSRYARAGMLDVIRSDYIRTARAKGLSSFTVIFKHAVRNGMIPVITLLGGILPTLIGGSVIIEVIFNINGMGLLAYESIINRDYNVVIGISMISAVLVLIGLLLVDIGYAVTDPRISFD